MPKAMRRKSGGKEREFSSAVVSCHMCAARSSKPRAINGQVCEDGCGGRASLDTVCFGRNPAGITVCDKAMAHIN
jgi:hypothetical protein